MTLYEGMFLLDNQAVRANWRGAKSVVTDVLEKHGAKIATARRWDERKLAYPIQGRQRGTYLLSYYELDVDGIDGLRRDLELSETVLRYLLLRAESVPEVEHGLHAAELDATFEVPPPPEDGAAEEAVDEEEQRGEPRGSARDGEEAEEDGDTADEEDSKEEEE